MALIWAWKPIVVSVAFQAKLTLYINATFLLLNWCFVAWFTIYWRKSGCFKIWLCNHSWFGTFFIGHKSKIFSEHFLVISLLSKMLLLRKGFLIKTYIAEKCVLLVWVYLIVIGPVVSDGWHLFNRIETVNEIVSLSARYCFEWSGMTLSI